MAMTEAGFFQQKRGSPTGFALVVMLHVGVLGAVMLAKGPTFIRPFHPPTKITFIEPPHDPDPIPPEPRPENPQPQHETVIDTFPPITPTRPTDTVVDTRPADPPSPFSGTGTDTGTRPADPPAPPPVRRAAEIDPRYAAALQPPYPPVELRAERSGVVRLRVTIGTDGRVIQVARLSATSDAFWAVAERQALSRWRFRPATLDGRPVESTKDMTLRFRIEDA
jgi:protein TonB